MPTTPLASPLEELCRPAEAAGLLRCSVGTLAQWRSSGTGPRYIKANGRVLYSRAALEEFLAAAGTEPPRLQRSRRQLNEAIGHFLGVLTSRMPADKRDTVFAALERGQAHYDLRVQWCPATGSELTVDLVERDGNRTRVLDLTHATSAAIAAAVAEQQDAAAVASLN